MKQAATSPGMVTVEDERERRLEMLAKQIRDLQLALLTSNEHGDLLQDQLWKANSSLSTEVRERQLAEAKLRRLVDAVSREKCDLENLVQILLDHGDASSMDGELARIDALTGVANRRRFDEFLSHEWQRHLRTSKPLAVMLCDVDHFKLYNDHYGHQAGDNCLVSVARTISAAARRATDLVARYGGEEFGIVLPDTRTEGAVQIGEGILAAMRSAALPHAESPVQGHVTLSIGIASRIPRREGPFAIRSFLEEADCRLYLAKHNGRDRLSCQDQ